MAQRALSLRRSLTTLLAAAAALTLVPFAPPPASAADVDAATAEELTAAVEDAGTEPTTINITDDIPLGDPDASKFDASIQLKRGANITLVSTDGKSLKQEGPQTVLNVPEGAQATLGEGLEITKGEPNIDRRTTVYSKGELTLDGARIHGLRRFEPQQAPIKASGSSQFTMRSGVIDGNHGGFGRPNAGALYVDNKASAHLLGGEIKNNQTGDSYSAGGVLIWSSGQSVLDGTKLTGNEAIYGGAINVIDTGKRAGFTPEKSEALRSKLEIRSGVISGNKAKLGYVDGGLAGGGGGGVNIWGNASVKMTGGEISGNTAEFGGGGVNAHDLCYQGSWNQLAGGFNCARYGIDEEDWPDLYPAEFNMTGGVIRNNYAHQTGGGINVASTKVKVSGGQILNNHASSQGGGIYVTRLPYKVQVDNAVVTRNFSYYWNDSFPGHGGGLWSCPTGHVTTHVNKGVALFDNSGGRWDYPTDGTFTPTEPTETTGVGDDFASEFYGGGFSDNKYKLSERMLGGGNADWVYDGSPNAATAKRYDPKNPEPWTKSTFSDYVGLKNIAAGDARSAARAEGRVLIAGNTSVRGAGIGTNGKVVFGEPGETEIKVHKTWENENDDFELPDSVNFDLIRTIDGKDYVIDTFSVKKSDDWTTTITGLPTKDADGNPIDYTTDVKIREASIGPWDSEVGKVEGSGDGYEVTVVNDIDEFTPPPGTGEQPTPTPTETPEPTPEPSDTPSETPTEGPSDFPTPTTVPSGEPTDAPTPSQTPGDKQTETQTPSDEPTEAPPAEPPTGTPDRPIPSDKPDEPKPGVTPLPRTGAQIALAAGVGLGAIALGIIAIVASRRSRK